MVMPTPICLRLLRQEMRLAFCLAEASAGSNSAARIAMIAMTTSNSIRVKARCLERFVDTFIALTRRILVERVAGSNPRNNLIPPKLMFNQLQDGGGVQRGFGNERSYFDVLGHF